jgi:hypothetical protein
MSLSQLKGPTSLTLNLSASRVTSLAGLEQLIRCRAPVRSPSAASVQVTCSQRLDPG